MPRSRLQINRVHYPVASLGYGKRVGIWTQGCTIHCPGCMSRDTWDRRPDLGISVSSLLRDMAQWLSQSDGVTISGGEPFDQADALTIFLRKLRQQFSGDILVYSGYAAEDIEDRFPVALDNIDVLVSDPYRLDLPPTRPLRGSDNQRMHLLTALADSRYDSDELPASGPANRALDVHAGNNFIWAIGIPDNQNDREARRLLRTRGYHLKRLSRGG